MACDNWIENAAQATYGDVLTFDNETTLYQPIQATASGYATRLRIYVDTFTIVAPARLSLYTDLVGEPDALLAQGDGIITGVGYLTIDLLASPVITAGTNYWIGVQVGVPGNQITVAAAPPIGGYARQAVYDYDDGFPYDAEPTYAYGESLYVGMYVACAAATTTSTSTSTSTTSSTSSSTSTTRTTSTSTSTSTTVTYTTTSTSTSTSVTLTSTSTSTSTTTSTSSTTTSTSTSTTTLQWIKRRRKRHIPVHVEVEANGQIFRPKVDSLRWGSNYSPEGGGFGYCTFSIRRQVGWDYEDIGYGLRVKIRKGLTLILFDGIITKITERREGGGVFEIGCIGWRVVFDNDRLNRIYADNRLADGAWSISTTPSGAFQPDKFDAKAGDELDLRPRTRVDFAANDYCETVYTVPAGQAVRWVMATYTTEFPAAYPFRFQIFAGDGTPVLDTTTTGTQSGTVTAVMSGTPTTVTVRLSITDSGESTAEDDPDTPDTEEGAYAKITSIIIATHTDNPVNMGTVMRDLVDYLHTGGHGISEDIVQIDTIDRQLLPAVFEDHQTPSEILKWCAQNGDNSGNPLVWGLELNDQRRAFLHAQDLVTVKYVLPPGETQAATTGDTQESAQKLYAVYSDDKGQYTTADSVDADAIADMNGYFRRDALRLDGVFSATLAVAALAMAMKDKSKPPVSSDWQIGSSVLSHTGKRVPFDEIMPGGIVVDRTLKAREATLSGNDARDRATTFYLVGVEVDYDQRSTRLIPDSDRSSLERYLDSIAKLTQT